VERLKEFDENLGTRKATYKPYAQAIPGAYVIEKLDKSPCTNKCPNHVNAHGYVALIRQGKYREALEVIMHTLPLPGVIGRVCPHPCESVCRRQQVEEPVSICALKRFVADRVDVEELPLPEIQKRDERVAIIGAGPAGLTAAYFLAKEGFGVTIFEALPVAGGMLRVGIPDYRLPPAVLENEIRAITRLGVEIRFNTALGRDVTVDGLFADGYKAIYLAIGAHRNIPLGIPGEESEGCIAGVEFLRKVNLGEITTLPGRTVIVGGGDVAIDAARCALRLGAPEVTILYRRTRTEMPARAEEIEDALAEGIQIQYLVAPNKIVTEGKRAVGIECLRMELGEPDASGRRRPIAIPGSEFVQPADFIIPAIGQQADVSPLAKVTGVEISRRATIEVDPVTFATGREGVFAGGDAQSGPWIAIGAVAAGREAAISITRYLRGEDLRAGRDKVEPRQEEFAPIPEDIVRTAREHPKRVDMADRVRGFAEVELGLSEEQGRAEADRCLNCMVCSECMQCVTACKAHAVRHDDKAEDLVINVGSIIAAPGFSEFDPRRADDYPYARFPNVVTSTEFERILSASGPFQGHLVRPSDHKEPKRIAWLQCVGSRDIHHCDHGYCSAVCCMYAIKEAVIAKEHSKEPLNAAIFFMDMRTYGKDFERYFNDARAKGVRFIRSRVHTIDQIKEAEDLRISYIAEDGRVQSEVFDMVVLSVGLESSAKARELAARLGIELDKDHFVSTSSFDPVRTSVPGVYACGTFQGPKDIPYSVMEASAAACAATAKLAPARGTLVQERTFPPEVEVTGERPRIGVFVCNCGVNIGGVVRVPEVVEYAKSLPNVTYVQENLFSCSQDAQDRLRQVIVDQKLNRVVVAACSPRTHEPLFQETLKATGLNKYLFEMANIRDQDSWVHQGDPGAATGKAKDLVRMAVAKASLLEPLREATVDINQAALVVGGGVAGMVAALELADQGYPVTLVEASSQLGGHARHLRKTWRGENVQAYLKELMARVQGHDNIKVRLDAQVAKVAGFMGNYQTDVRLEEPGGAKTLTVQHGVAILATGAHPTDPNEYLRGQHPGVLIWHELEDAFVSGRLDEAHCVVFIQCVGSREPERPYCSKICCTFSVQQAIALKEARPKMDVFILYRDIRTYGMREELYRKARALGVVFIRYSTKARPLVEVDRTGRLQIQVMDHVLQRPITLSPDFITLATAIETRGVETLSQMFKVSVNADRFFAEAHPKLRPVDFATDGVYLCGLAHYPKPLEETIAQAQAAVSRAITLLSKKKIQTSGQVARVTPAKCSACGVCVTICPFTAPAFNDRGVAEVNQALCKGCGLCVASCRSGAIDLKGFEDKQIFAMIDQV
jgi:heterodisulfide reductase subunit A-like polyferredoxin